MPLNSYLVFRTVLHSLCLKMALCADMAAKSATLLALVPSVISRETTVDVSKAATLYTSDLPTPELLDQELLRWKIRYQNRPAESRPDTCSEALRDCNPADFPNIAVLLQIACTLPVTSCECERSASALRRLHTWTRASMGQERLSSLALINIHRAMPVDLDEVVELFACMHPRKMELGNVLSY